MTMDELLKGVFECGQCFNSGPAKEWCAAYLEENNIEATELERGLFVDCCERKRQKAGQPG